ncbi:uncharacterized protein IL334_002310 [Kwoniella shivajii]|uniref:BTB domain-containing protein n=1 Tax=Kwoniella shivajii TaxID=564305 RepID=A0ABZ1CYJ2_9TREE|nr:hypothetical protein IL334_002310 [Kwoniella shivajii]
MSSTRATSRTGPIDWVGELPSDERYNDPDADFILVSSDDVGFRVKRGFLQAYSRTWEATLNSDIHPEAHLNLIDEDIENSHVIRLFLDLQIGHEIKLTRGDLGIMRSCVDFGIKYNCPSLNALLSSQGRKMLQQPDVGPGKIFILAAHLNDARLAADAIRNSGNLVCSEPPTPRNGRSRSDIPSRVVVNRPLNEVMFMPIPLWWTTDQIEENLNHRNRREVRGRGAMEIASWPWAEVFRLPLEYVFALSRTAMLHNLQPGQRSYEHAARCFLDIIEG